MIWYFYIVRCSDNSLYSGVTTDIKRRIKVHNLGKGAKYTRSRLPVKLKYSEKYRTRVRAMQREWEVKQFTRKEKLLLIKEGK